MADWIRRAEYALDALGEGHKGSIIDAANVLTQWDTRYAANVVAHNMRQALLHYPHVSDCVLAMNRMARKAPWIRRPRGH